MSTAYLTRFVLCVRSFGRSGLQHGLELDQSSARLLGRKVVLCAFQIALDTDLEPQFRTSMTLEQARRS